MGVLGIIRGGGGRKGSTRVSDIERCQKLRWPEGSTPCLGLLNGSPFGKRSTVFGVDA